MRRRFALAALAIGLAGCGSASHKTGTGTSNQQAQAAKELQEASEQTAKPATGAEPAPNSTSGGETTEASQGPPECESVDLQKVKECKQKGSLIHVAQGTNTLHLKTLDANVESVTTADSVSNGPDFTAVAKGKYVIVTLKITNKLSSPQSFDSGIHQPTHFNTAKAIYSEAFNAENEKYENSCVTKNGESIQPGESLTCAVIFDVPPSVAAHTSEQVRGIFIENFGAEKEGEGEGWPAGTGFIDISGM